MKKLIILLLLILPHPVFAENVCHPREIFANFYAAFKFDSNFQLQRTRFPVKKTVFAGRKIRVSYISRQSVIDGEEYLYLDQGIMQEAGYHEFFKNTTNGDVTVLVGPESSEPIVRYLFQNRFGCWYLVEYKE